MPDHDKLPRVAFGPCCACGQTGPSVRNVLMLPYRARTPGAGCWGCGVCDLETAGAVTVVCDDCLAKQRQPEQACDGPLEQGRRVPITELTEPFAHDLDRHQAHVASVGRTAAIRTLVQAAEPPRVWPPYREPLGVPLYWRDEQSGALVGAMATYLYHALGAYPTPPTAAQLTLIRDYLHYYIHAPCWATAGIETEIADLRARAKTLDSVEAIRDWLEDALVLGLDPL